MSRSGLLASSSSSSANPRHNPRQHNNNNNTSDSIHSTSSSSSAATTTSSSSSANGTSTSVSTFSSAAINITIPPLHPEILDDLYGWIQSVPLSRPRKNITRDFSDAVMAAEIVAHFLPRYIDLHAFLPANSTNLKRSNWETMNKRVFTHLDFTVSDDMIQAVIEHRSGAVEYVLYQLRLKIELALSQGRFKPRRRRSRSSGSRTGSNLSLNKIGFDEMTSEQQQQQQQTLDSPHGILMNGSGNPGAAAAVHSARQSRKSQFASAVSGGSSTPGSAKFLNSFKMSSSAAASSKTASMNGEGEGMPATIPTSQTQSIPANNKPKCEDLVPARVVHGLQEDIIDKDEMIQNLQNRIKFLGMKVRLKEDRIEELTMRLDKLAQVFYSHQEGACGPLGGKSSRNKESHSRPWLQTSATASEISSGTTEMQNMAASLRAMLAEATKNKSVPEGLATSVSHNNTSSNPTTNHASSTFPLGQNEPVRELRMENSP